MSVNRRQAPAVRRSTSGLPPISELPWRGLSFAMVLLLMLLVIIVFASPAFYVHSIEVGGNRYVPPEEIFAESGIVGFHILWVEPNEVAERLEESQSIDSAEVYARWPARVVILIREREPALAWRQGESTYWVDVNGNLMVYRQDVPNLIQIINESDSIPFRCPGPACPEGVDAITLSPEVVSGAQQLKSLRPEISVLYYDEVNGLSYDDARGWRVYVGTGVNMDVKLRVYDQVLTDLLGRGIVPQFVNVGNPQAPFYELSDESG